MFDYFLNTISIIPAIVSFSPSRSLFIRFCFEGEFLAFHIPPSITLTIHPDFYSMFRFILTDCTALYSFSPFPSDSSLIYHLTSQMPN